MRVGVSCTYKESGKGDGGDEVGEEEARTKNEAQQKSPKKGYKERKQWKPRHWSWGNLYYLAIFWGLSPMHRTSAFVYTKLEHRMIQNHQARRNSTKRWVQVAFWDWNGKIMVLLLQENKWNSGIWHGHKIDMSILYISVAISVAPPEPRLLSLPAVHEPSTSLL
uniref:HDC03194 n=1 Tax=Drosophila melanogaster TaxID=7227 RepID=Q6IH64_DROME|nr:TPA_inf: HDC03194 [Drosophila melanogaster]